MSNFHTGITYLEEDNYAVKKMVSENVRSQDHISMEFKDEITSLKNTFQLINIYLFWTFRVSSSAKVGPAFNEATLEAEAYVGMRWLLEI